MEGGGRGDALHPPTFAVANFSFLLALEALASIRFFYFLFQALLAGSGSPASRR